ncbi:MAG: hypothetical protein K8L97_21320 [Anaerolineae bacterium]|nr:hypothetical protein [Anaerolineae bacterium]
MRRICLCLSFLLFTAQVAAQPTAILDLPGSIAYIGIDGNVYSIDSQRTDTTVLTDDANLEKQYVWPTWSTDGRLAYFQTGLMNNQIETNVYISSDGHQPGNLAYTVTGEIFTYAYWSPQNCVDESNCRNLAVLLSNPRDQLFSVRLIRNTQHHSEQMLAGLGAPFYYSWSPDGLRMLWQRNDERVDVFRTDTPEVIDILPFKPGRFQSPAWSPIDDRWLIGSLATDSRSTDLVIIANGEAQRLAEQLAGPISFSWSPNGDYAAYMDANGPIFVIDTYTGETISRAPVNGVYAFFWSPDSNHIAYITSATAPGSLIAGANAKTDAAVQNITRIAWSILDIKTDSVHSYGAFQPTNEMIYLLSFFDQFAQSHHVWSPDSRFLIYSEIAGEQGPIVSVLDTTQPDTVPFSIAQGVIGIWNFNL